MSKISEMNKTELLEYCLQKKLEGDSFTEIIKMLNSNGVDKAVKTQILDKLKEVDQLQAPMRAAAHRSALFKSSIIKLIVGFGLIALALVMYKATSAEGFVFVFNIIMLVYGLYSIIQGIMGLLMGADGD